MSCLNVCDFGFFFSVETFLEGVKGFLPSLMSLFLVSELNSYVSNGCGPRCKQFLLSKIMNKHNEKKINV